MEKIIIAKITKIGKERFFLYIPVKYRYLISTDSNSRIKVLINGEYVSKLYDENYRIMGLVDWYNSQDISINSTIIIIKSKEGYELKVLPNKWKKTKVDEIRRILKDMFKDASFERTINYKDIKDNWTEKKITFEELRDYINKGKSIRIKYFRLVAQTDGITKRPVKYLNKIIIIGTYLFSIFLKLI